MKKNEIKNKFCKSLERLVKESVGRSVPIIYHEPKVPECLLKSKK